MTDIATLTVAEADCLADCEQRIERGLKTFVEVGTSLATIRDNRLYRTEHGTFEDYVEARWQLSRAHAYRMITAAAVVSPMGDAELPLPTTERQARELARVPEPDRAEVWRETVERTDGKPTAAAIRAVHDERTETPATMPETEAAGVDVPAASVQPDDAWPPVAPPGVAEALDRFAPDADAPHREWRRNFLGAVNGAYRPISRSTVQEVAERADEECVAELARVAAELTTFAEQVRAIRSANRPKNVLSLVRPA